MKALHWIALLLVFGLVLQPLQGSGLHVEETSEVIANELFHFNRSVTVTDRDTERLLTTSREYVNPACHPLLPGTSVYVSSSSTPIYILHCSFLC